MLFRSRLRMRIQRRGIGDLVNVAALVQRTQEVRLELAHIAAHFALDWGRPFAMIAGIYLQRAALAARACKFRACKCGVNKRHVKNAGRRLTGLHPGLYCAPFHLKRDFRDFPAIDGVQNRAILGSSARTFVVLGNSLKIRIGNLCGDSRLLPLMQLMMSFQNDQLFIREQM